MEYVNVILLLVQVAVACAGVLCWQYPPAAEWIGRRLQAHSYAQEAARVEYRRVRDLVLGGRVSAEFLEPRAVSVHTVRGE